MSRNLYQKSKPRLTLWQLKRLSDTRFRERNKKLAAAKEFHSKEIEAHVYQIVGV